MKSFYRNVIVFALVFGAQIQPLKAQSSGLDAPTPIGPFLNGIFPVEAPRNNEWTTVNAFPGISFIDPMWLTSYPGDDELVVVGKQGMLWRFQNRQDVAQSEVVEMLDWRSNTQRSADQGMYSVAFHPDFGKTESPNRDYLYITYSHRPALPDANSNNSYFRLSRFEVIEETGIIDPESELVLVNQYDPHRWHQGGALFFDDEGYLFFSSGDGGEARGSLGLTQKIDFGIYSGIFRIDVDKDESRSHPILRQPQSHFRLPSGWPKSFTQEYFIPNDNPFVTGDDSVLGEYYALGTRSPHTMQYDSLTGQIWVGDVGDAAREEVSLVQKGANLQWNYKEGFANGFSSIPENLIGMDTPPVIDWPRSEAWCIIGGHIYRGTQFADSLGGKLIVGDHVFGKIWSVAHYPGQSPYLELLMDDFPHEGAKSGLANICRDSEGEEVYFMTLNGIDSPGGTIRKLVRSSDVENLPEMLSQTGVFTNMETLAPAPGLVPYAVNSPLWSDRAVKSRWIALPNDGIHDMPDEQIVFDESGNWIFPAGTVFVKHFELPDIESDPDSTVRLETRFLVCTENGGKYGVTYRWLPGQSDAVLLAEAESGDYSVIDQDEIDTSQSWSFPSRGDCLTCHNNIAGQALGVKTYQLNRDRFYPSTGRIANQLETWNALAMFDRTLLSQDIGNFMALRNIDDTTAPLEHRIRSYLDSNCSHCHQPGGAGIGFDARLSTPLSRQGIINGNVQRLATLGPDAKYIHPGQVSNSAIYDQLMRVEGEGMPPLAKNLVDSNAIRKLTDYIQGLTQSEFELPDPAVARFVRFTALEEIENGPWTSMAEFQVFNPEGSTIVIESVSADSVETSAATFAVSNVIDGSLDTFWHTRFVGSTPDYPHWLMVDLGSAQPVGGYRYFPRQGLLTDSPNNGRVDDWKVEISVDGVEWKIIDEVYDFGNTIESYTFDSLLNSRPVRALLAGPDTTTSDGFQATLTFDSNISGLEESDFEIANGTVKDLRGGGYYYVVDVQPSGSSTELILPENVVVDSVGFGNLASPLIDVTIIENTMLTVWLGNHGLEGTYADPDADPDRDHFPNWVEYVYDMNPVIIDASIDQSNSPRAMLFEQEDKTYVLRMVFRRRTQAEADHLEYVVRFTSTLSESNEIVWSESNSEVEVTPIDENWELVVIEDSAALVEKNARFAQLIIRSYFAE